MKPCELLDRLVYIAKEASVEPHFNSELPEDRLIPLIAFADSIATAGQNMDGLREMAALYLAGFEAGHNYALKYGSLVEQRNPLQAGLGQCHRRATAHPSTGGQSPFPVVESTDWCGDFEEASQPAP